MVNIMAIFYVRASIIKKGKGKSAIASAAYQSGEKLYDTQLGKTFHYTGKEEIVYEEILLPATAPEEYKNREILWNSVEEQNHRSNSRYARQFVIAVPNEWNQEETLINCRQFIQESFVDRGMIVDWAYHEKSDNHHIHVMCTTRRVKPDGSFEPMEKKDYELDEKGERIPIIDSVTGEQKVRIRERNGYRSEEKLWKRVSVQTNDWNSRKFLKQVKQEWANICNFRLSESQRIDPRSHQERGLETLPMLHEGSCVREMTKRGIETEVSKENFARKKYNETLSRLNDSIKESEIMIDKIVTQLIRRGSYGTRIDTEAIIHGKCLGNNSRISNNNNRTVKRDRLSSEAVRYSQSEQSLSNLPSERISDLLKRSEELLMSGNKQKHRHRI